MIIYGRNPVTELLGAASARILELYTTLSERELSELLAVGPVDAVRIRNVTRQELTQIAGTEHHQGVAARIPDVAYRGRKELAGAGATVLVVDSIEDPHNLGAIARSAFFFGVTDIVLRSRRQVLVTPAVIKASAGAALSVTFYLVPNLRDAVTLLRGRGYTIIAAGIEGGAPLDVLGELPPLRCLIVGNEGEGVQKILLKESDHVVYIQTHAGSPSSVDSLNVSVATGILLYEMTRGRP